MRKMGQSIGVVAAALLVAFPAAAQSRGGGVTLSARGGGFNEIKDLNGPRGTIDFDTGYNVGGGIGYELTPNLVLRGDLTYTRLDIRNRSLGTGEHVNRYIYTGAIQVQTAGAGLKPYGFVGGGLVTIDPSTAGSKTKGVGTFGAGLSLPVGGNGFAVFTEGSGYVYRLSKVRGTLQGFSRTQLDFTWSGGLSYRFGL